MFTSGRDQLVADFASFRQDDMDTLSFLDQFDYDVYAFEITEKPKPQR